MVNETEIDGRLMMLQQQRDEAMNRCVILAGQLAVIQKELAGLKEKEEKQEN